MTSLSRKNLLERGSGSPEKSTLCLRVCLNSSLRDRGRSWAAFALAMPNLRYAARPASVEKVPVDSWKACFGFISMAYGAIIEMGIHSRFILPTSLTRLGAAGTCCLCGAIAMRCGGGRFSASTPGTWGLDIDVKLFRKGFCVLERWILMSRTTPGLRGPRPSSPSNLCSRRRWML